MGHSTVTLSIDAADSHEMKEHAENEDNSTGAWHDPRKHETPRPVVHQHGDQQRYQCIQSGDDKPI